MFQKEESIAQSKWVDQNQERTKRTEEREEKFN